MFSSKLPNTKTSIFSVMSALSNKHDAINLSQGFPDYETDKKLSKLVYHYMREGLNQYAPMAGVMRLRNSIAEKIDYLYGKKVNPSDEITITAGATEALYSAITTFVRSGDEVVIIEPAYDSYIPAIKLNGGIAVPYRLKSPNFKINWKKFETLISDKTKMIIINTPNNPTTTIFKEKDMLALEEILKKYKDIVLLSDEVYEHIIFDNQLHQTVLKYPFLYKRSLAVYSFGKLFHTTGWKVGYIVGPQSLMNEFRKVHQFNVFSVNTPVQHALSDYLDRSYNYQLLPTFFNQKKLILENELKDTGFKILPSQGSYFLLADYSELSNQKDTSFAKELVKKYGVATIPISPFYSKKMDQKLLRFCFAKKDETLLKAGKRLKKVK